MKKSANLNPPRKNIAETGDRTDSGTFNRTDATILEKTKRTDVLIKFIDVFKELNTAEIELIRFFAETFYVSKRRTITPAKVYGWTAYLQTALRKNYTHLHELGIIVRVRKGTYHLDPDLFNYRYKDRDRK